MPNISEGTRAVWDQLRLQISPFTSVVTIDGHVFCALNNSDRNWIAIQYRSIVNVEVIYVFDRNLFRIFLARTDMFPVGSLIPASPGNMVAVVNPLFMGQPPLQLGPQLGPQLAPQLAPQPGPQLASIMGSSAPLQVNESSNVKIPRPANAFILYRKAHHEAVKAANPGIHNNQISVILGTQWQCEDAGVRAQYKAQAIQLKQKHMEKHPGYQYQPRKASDLKRRMTKKKAARMDQNDTLPQDVPGTRGLSSGQGVPPATGNWRSLDHYAMDPNSNTGALLDQVHLHNTQQELTQDLDESFPQINIVDSLHQGVWAIDQRERDAFEEFIHSSAWSGINF